MMNNRIEVWKVNEEGNLRVAIDYDEYPDEPYFYAGSPLLRFNGRYSRDTEHVYGYVNDACDSAVAGAARKWGIDDPRFEKYLRAYHGVTEIKTFSTRDYRYVTYDSQCFKDETGAPDGSADFTEYEAWCNGEVYAYVVEKLVHWTPDDPEFPARDEWETVDSCGGFYGDDAVKEAADQAFAEATEAEG